MEMELGEQLSEEIVSQRVQFHIQELFGFEI
jgi:hypothetical protein